MREGGEIVAWFEDRGFGFIRPDIRDSGGDVFLHVSQIKNGGKAYVGARAMFEIHIGGSKKRPQASDAEII